VSRYSEQLTDHLAHPRNPGPMTDASGVGRASNEACGDLLDLYLRLEGGLIQAASFRASGCAPALAAGSVLTELLAGLTPAEARAVTAEQIETALGGVPRAKRHALRLALDAVELALVAAEQNRSS